MITERIAKATGFSFGETVLGSIGEIIPRQLPIVREGVRRARARSALSRIWFLDSGFWLLGAK